MKLCTLIDLRYLFCGIKWQFMSRRVIYNIRVVKFGSSCFCILISHFVVTIFQMTHHLGLLTLLQSWITHIIYFQYQTVFCFSFHIGSLFWILNRHVCFLSNLFVMFCQEDSIIWLSFDLLNTICFLLLRIMLLSCKLQQFCATITLIKLLCRA